MAGFFLVQNSPTMPDFGIPFNSPRSMMPVPIEVRRARASQRASRLIRNRVLLTDLMGP